jgi:hypothetical protein
VVYACNPSYSASRDQEDPGSKLTQANIIETLSKIPNIKQGWQSDSNDRVLA